MSRIAALRDRMRAAGVDQAVIDDVLDTMHEAVVEAVQGRHKPAPADPPRADRTKAAERMARYRANRVAGGMSPYFNGSEFRPEITARDGAGCVYCDAPDAPTIDHMVPVSLGGTDHIDNLAIACNACNGGKSGRLPEGQYSIRRASALVAHQRYLSHWRTVRGEQGEQGERSSLAPPDGPPSFPQTPNQPPLNPPTPSSTAGRGHALPASWQPNEGHFERARLRGVGRPWVNAQAEKLRDWAEANRNRAVARKADWDRTFNGWIDRELDRIATRPGSTGPPPRGANAYADLALRFDAETREPPDERSDHRPAVEILPPERRHG